MLSEIFWLVIQASGKWSPLSPFDLDSDYGHSLYKKVKIEWIFILIFNVTFLERVNDMDGMFDGLVHEDDLMKKMLHQQLITYTPHI